MLDNFKVFTTEEAGAQSFFFSESGAAFFKMPWCCFMLHISLSQVQLFLKTLTCGEDARLIVLNTWWKQSKTLLWSLLLVDM